jgi:hypothetical protein
MTYDPFLLPQFFQRQWNIFNWIMAQVNHLIDRRQFGALRVRSTTHALVSLSHHISTAFLKNLINV